MACFGVYHGVTGECHIRKPASFIDVRSDRNSLFNHLHSFSISNVAVKTHIPMISAVAAVVSDRPVSISNQVSSSINADLAPVERIVDDDNECYDHTIDSPRVSEKLDEWIRDSVTEIVKNIKEAPLLVKIYSDGKVKTEKAVAEDWPNVITDAPSAVDGIILVEEIPEKRDRKSGDECKEKDGSRAFGVLIQGKVKGRDQCKSACYLLKTTRVNGGLGIFCTHFCLMKVQSFTKSAFSQLNECWLLQ